jgi:hypothetical protein
MKYSRSSFFISLLCLSIGSAVTCLKSFNDLIIIQIEVYGDILVDIIDSITLLYSLRSIGDNDDSNSNIIVFSISFCLNDRIDDIPVILVILSLLCKYFLTEDDLSSQYSYIILLVIPLIFKDDISLNNNST